MRSLRCPRGPWGWCDACFSLELAQLWEVGASLFPALGFPLKKVSLGIRKTWWSIRKNRALLRAEGMTVLKHGMEDVIGHGARSQGLDSGRGCRKPRLTCNQALDLDLQTSFPEHLTGRAFHSQFIQSFIAV